MPYDKSHSSGYDRIVAAFQSAKKRKAAALMPYYTLGYPDEETSLRIIEEIASYSDILELGIPFSDPLADGPTIQKSTQAALEQGVSTRMCLEMVATLREKGIQAPLLLMGYFNPILSYGCSGFISDAMRAGVDGLLVPDLPHEEATELGEMAEDAGLALIRFVSLSSSAPRIAEIVTGAKGFVYTVSILGVTGARHRTHGMLPDLVARIRELSDIPVAVGFGVGTPSQAANIGSFADGVIVGSALIDAVDAVSDGKLEAAARFVQAFQLALQR